MIQKQIVELYIIYDVKAKYHLYNIRNIKSDSTWLKNIKKLI